jgi:hypothetical protein
MRDCVNRDGKTTFMMTSQIRINKSEFFRVTINKRQEATIIFCKLPIIYYLLMAINIV